MLNSLESAYYQNSQSTSEDSHNLWLSYPPRKRAAVLAILFPLQSTQDNVDYGIVLTQRSARLKTSPSVTALPGGKVDPEDNDDEWATALREAKEEIGFDPANFPANSITKLGISPCYLSLGNDAVRLCAVLVQNSGDAPDDNLDAQGWLKKLAPSVSFAEVELTYIVSLKSLLTSKSWYIQGEEMKVASYNWIFHDYDIQRNETAAWAKSVPDDLPQHQFMDTVDSGSESDSNRVEDKIVPNNNSITLHGLTAHMAVDLAMAVYPSVKPEFKVLPYLGSDDIVKKYHQLKYPPSM